MKLALKIFGYVLLAFIVISYVCFLFVLPNKLDLNTFVPDIKTIANENSDFNIDVDNLKLYTNPLLSIGVRAENVKISYSDGSELISIANADVRVAPLSIFLLTAKSPSIVVNSPSIYLDVPDGRRLKILNAIEEMANRNVAVEEEKQEEESFFDPSWIKVKLSKILINNYSIVIKDNSTGHDVTLKGDKLFAYYDGKKIKIKADSSITNNGNQNITANVDFMSILPKKKEVYEDDDPAAALALPYINPVKEFEKLNPKAVLDVKLKARQRENKISARGYVNIDGLSAEFSGYELPKSYIHAKLRGYTLNLDTDMAYAENQRIKLNGDLNYGNGPWINMSFLTDKLYFNDMLKVTKAVMDTYGVKNNIDELAGSGYLETNLKLKTNFKKLNSQGYIKAAEGNISNKNFGSLVADINGTATFNKNEMTIGETRAVVNDSNFKLEGDIDEKSNLNLNIVLNKMPLKGSLLKFAPREIKDVYRIQDGLLNINAKFEGKLSHPVCSLKTELDNLVLKDIKNNIIYSNKNNTITIYTDFENVDGKVINTDFAIDIPSTDSKIKSEKITIDIGSEHIIFEPSNLKLNSSSLVGFMGEITNYRKRPDINFDVFGALNTKDLNKLLGPQGSIFMASNGALPFRVFLRGNEKLQNIIFQMISNGGNYYTPLNIKELMGKTTLTQANIRMQNGTLNIKNSGIYIKGNNERLTSDYELNAENAQPVIEARGTIIGLNTPYPSINILKIQAPKDLHINLAVFKQSSAILSLKAFVYGAFENIKTSGKIKISKLIIPEIKTTLEEGSINLEKTIALFDVNKLLLDNSDIELNAKWNFHALPIFHLQDVVIISNYIDLDKLTGVVELLNGYITPKNTTTAQNPEKAGDIPAVISSGNIALKRIKTGSIIVDNTRARLFLKNNILSVKNIAAQVFKGRVHGGVDVNLINGKISIDMAGSKIDVAKALADAANVKDALSGTASFKALLSLAGATYEEQMKSLDGAIIFNIKDGSFGPFGKLENLILAENIRESEFFQTALGGVINSLATIDTARFETLEGLINLKDGAANITEIKSTGNVLSFLIFGDMDILKNELDVKFRGKMASNISDMLGPIAVLNPVNLIKQTPGVNIVFAKAFSLFTVTVTKEEIDKLPSFASNHTDENATSFQIVLRGDVNKPLKLIKSFKWLASNEDMEKAEQFLKNVIQIQQEQAEAQRRKDRFNIVKKIKNALNKEENE